MSIDNVDKLTRFELHMLGRFLLHHMDMDTRRKLMVQLPVVYRKVIGREVTDGFTEGVRQAVLGQSKLDTSVLPPLSEITKREEVERNDLSFEIMDLVERSENDANNVDTLIAVREKAATLARQVAHLHKMWAP